MSRVTITRVAEEAGVSAGTASLVLNGRAREKRISDECVERVQEAAGRLGYHGSYHARTLLRGKSMTLGFVCRVNENDLVRCAVEAGLAAEANERGYEILSLSIGDGRDTIKKAVRYVRQGRLDGFAIFISGWTYSEVAESIPPDVPAAHIWFSPAGYKPVVTLDPAPGIREAVQHLAELGHKRVTWIGVRSPSRGVEVQDRLEVFREAASAAGLEPAEHFIPVKVDMPGESNRTVSEFRKRFSGNLELLQDATAAICYNDTMATALCIALNERGLRVPDDVSVVGFDDTQAIYAAPPLTTISHSFAQMGCAAVSYLNDWIESDAERTEEIIRVPSRLVVRESTAAPTEL